MISDDLGYLHDLGHLQLMMFNGGIAFYGDIQWDIQWEVSAEKRIHILGFVFSELISPWSFEIELDVNINPACFQNMWSSICSIKQ